MVSEAYTELTVLNIPFLFNNGSHCFLLNLPTASKTMSYFSAIFAFSKKYMAVCRLKTIAAVPHHPAGTKKGLM